MSRKIIYTVNSEDVDWQGAYKLVDKFHPAAHRLKPYAKRLHARNSFQVLGNDLMTPSSFVICWTPEFQLDDRGAVCNVSGGTGQAVRIAYAHKIPVIHIGHRLVKNSVVSIFKT